MSYKQKAIEADKKRKERLKAAKTIQKKYKSYKYSQQEEAKLNKCAGE